MINEHEKIEMLLPWFVTGTLDANEMAQVDSHLLACPECRLALIQEHQFKTEIASMPVAIPSFAPPAAMTSRRPSTGSNVWQSARQAVSRWKARPMRVAAFAAAQAAMLLIVFQLAQPTTGLETQYRTLSSGKVTSKANAVVMFDADTRESDFRKILVEVNANIVGGPTEGNSYYLVIDPATRASKLERLQANPQVLLTQPIDGE